MTTLETIIHILAVIGGFAILAFILGVVIVWRAASRDGEE